MIKKLLILCCSLSLCFSISGCSFLKKDEPTISKISSDLPDKEVVDSDFEDVPTTQKVVLSEDILRGIQDYTSKFSHIKVSQRMTSYSLLNYKRNSEKELHTVDVDLDIKNKLNLAKIVMNGNTYSFADDDKNNIHLSKVNDGQYLASDTSSSSIKVDYSKVKNAYNYVEYICNGQMPEIGSSGILDNNTYTFTVERDALKEDLENITYDRLGTTSIEFIVDEDEQGNLVPRSISMNTTFFVGQIEYGVATVCTFSDFSNQTLKLPKYTKVKE